MVDLLLPDLRGSDVLIALRSHQVPAIAISGVYKGHRFATEATSVYGAKAFFEKPFRLEALLEAIEGLCGATASNKDEGSSEALLGLTELEALEPIQAPATSEATPPEPSPDQWDDLWKKGRTARATARPSAPALAAAGQLAESSVPRLLNAYYQAEHSGELKLRRGQVLKVVCFEEGRPIYAASNLAQERFARFCAQRGMLPPTELTAVATLASEGGLRTGDAMVKLGLISEEQRAQLLEEQVKEIIWSTFSWREGQYAFSSKGLARADLVKLSVFPGDLIVEGVFRTETLVSLRQRMPPARRLFPTADPPYGLEEFKLSGAQAFLLAWADGTKSVEDLLTLSDLSAREALASLVAFELLGMLEERREDGKQRRISFGL